MGTKGPEVTIGTVGFTNFTITKELGTASTHLSGYWLSIDFL
jgi:hypothetical protein